MPSAKGIFIIYPCDNPCHVVRQCFLTTCARYEHFEFLSRYHFNVFLAAIGSADFVRYCCCEELLSPWPNGNAYLEGRRLASILDTECIDMPTRVAPFDQVDGGHAYPRTLSLLHNSQLTVQRIGLGVQSSNRVISLSGRGFHLIKLSPHNAELESRGNDKERCENCNPPRPRDHVSIHFLLDGTCLVAECGFDVIGVWSIVFWGDRRGWWLVAVFSLGIAIVLTGQSYPLLFVGR